MKIMREREGLRLSIKIFFYPSNLKNEVTLTKKEKVLREASLKKDPELSFGDVKLEILIRHPSIDAK